MITGHFVKTLINELNPSSNWILQSRLDNHYKEQIDVGVPKIAEQLRETVQRTEMRG